ncbi:MAG: hypothetical protein OXG79_12635 [Chloroflexi bacterium]|nr:hypothetical protein [Chloroflexota bacterium]
MATETATETKQATEQEMAMENLQWTIDSTRKQSQNELASFAEKLTKSGYDAAHAFSWGGDALLSAARLDVIENVEHMVQRVVDENQDKPIKPEKALALLDDWMLRQVREGARVNASTSGMSNITALARAEVATVWFDDHGWGSTPTRRMVAKALGC